MNRPANLALALVIAVSLLVAGCGQTAPALAPTAPPAPAKAPAATQAPAAATNAPAPAPAAATKAPEAPAKKVDFPAQGKSVTVIVPVPAGGPADVGTRLLIPLLENDLGVRFNVLNREGGGTQVGITELAKAKPDGYTIGLVTLPQVLTIYMDPERQAAFGRKDLVPLALHVFDPMTVAVKADSPFKTPKDIIDAAKANPEKVKTSTGGYMGTVHLALLDWQRLTGAKFAVVHFTGSADALAAVLGGHTDVMTDGVGAVYTRVKSGDLRALAVMDNQESRFLPGVKTLDAQGYKVNMAASRAFVAPAGTPKEILDILSAAFKKAINSEEHKKKAEDAGLTLRYMDPAQLDAYWTDMEGQVKPLIDMAKAEAKK